MKKVLTILIPVYNTEKYIKRCLDSILLKDIVNDIEVIVVSDGSIDKSSDIVKKYMKKYPESMTLIEKENGGHGSTINKGIEIATGKYFRVLDSDDWVNCIDFIKFVKYLKNEEADLVVTNYRQEHVYNQESIPFNYEGLTERKVIEFDKFDLSKLNGEYFVMATSTYKLDVLKKSQVHLLEKTFYVDMQYNVVPITSVKTVVFYNLDIYRYYIGRKEQSINVSSFVKNQDDHEKVMRFLLEYYNKIKDNISKNKREYIKTILYYMLNTHYTIYCKYDKNKKNAYKKVKSFDKYLKSINEELYQATNKLSFIRLHRKFNFFFVRYFSKLHKKLYHILLVIKNKVKGNR